MSSIKCTEICEARYADVQRYECTLGSMHVIVLVQIATQAQRDRTQVFNGIQDEGKYMPAHTVCSFEIGQTVASPLCSPEISIECSHPHSTFEYVKCVCVPVAKDGRGPGFF